MSNSKLLLRLCAVFLLAPLMLLIPRSEATASSGLTGLSSGLTTCSQLSGSASCGSGTFNCVHSASVDCGEGLFVAEVTYTTVCQRSVPPGGTYESTTVASRLKATSDMVKNRCQCELSPSGGRTWGQICDLGDCCTCFELICF